MTGEVIRASKTTTIRYERDRPGELVHMDVKMVGRIPDGGGCAPMPGPPPQTAKHHRPKAGFDYVHSSAVSAIDTRQVRRRQVAERSLRACLMVQLQVRS